MADRYVFQYNAGSSAEELFKFYREIGGTWYGSRTDEQLMDLVNGIASAAKARDGWYEKEGGHATPHLSEAKVIGWRSFKKWAAREDGSLLPVEIVLK